MGGVVCSGNIVLDILTRPVDEIPWGGTHWVESIDYELGGNGASTAFTIARIGIRARLLGAVGHDDAGKMLLARLQAVGVDTTYIEQSAEPTTTTVGLVKSDGTRALLLQPGCSRTVFAEPIDFTPHKADGYAHYHLGNPFSLMNLRGHAAETLQRARAAGLSTSMDTAWDPLGEWMKIVAPALPHADFLFANAEEARMLTGHADPAAAARSFRDAGAQVVVIKLAAEGCKVFTTTEEWHSQGLETMVVDTTGAGDCFVGAFLAALELGLSYPDAAGQANVVGALSVSAMGATRGLASLPYRTAPK